MFQNILFIKILLKYSIYFLDVLKKGSLPIDKYSDFRDSDPIKNLNQPEIFPFNILGNDGLTYIFDQFADPDGVFALHVINKSGPYSYKQVYDGTKFMLKGNMGPVPSALNAFIVKHYLGN